MPLTPIGNGVVSARERELDRLLDRVQAEFEQDASRLKGAIEDVGKMLAELRATAR
jgi:hypothetical protein